MKTKVVTLILAAVMVVMTGCGTKKGPDGSTDYKPAEEFLTAVYSAYNEDEKFPVAGGDSENMVPDQAGTFNKELTEELDMVLGIPEEEAVYIEDIASMVHMMNGNTFTSAAIRLNEKTDIFSFSDHVKENVLQRQWLCGSPEKFLIIDAGNGCIVSAFGQADIMETFKEKVSSVSETSEVVVEEDIVENY